MSYKTIADRIHKCPDILENGVYFIIRKEKNLHPTSDVIIFETSVFTRPQDYVKFPFPKTHSLKIVLKNLRFCDGNAVKVIRVKKYPFSKKSGYLLTRSQSVLVKGSSFCIMYLVLAKAFSQDYDYFLNPHHIQNPRSNPYIF